VNASLNPFEFVDPDDSTTSKGWAYLANSDYRDQGVLTIDSGLAAALKTRTTYPPGVYNSSTGFPAAIPRDSNTPDLGYHYDPIDCIASYGSNGGASLINVPPGYVVAATSGKAFVINGYAFGSLGTPTARSWIVRHEMVQEGDGTVSAPSSRTLLELDGPYGSGVSSVDLKFSGLSTMAGGIILKAASKTSFINLSNCEVYGGDFKDEVQAEYGRTITLWNSVFCRSTIRFDSQTSGGVKVTAASSTFDRCYVSLYPASANKWHWKDNLFTSSTVAQNSCAVSGSFNAYHNAGGITRISPTSSSDLILGSHLFNTGTLGSYYLPTSSPLINAGSVPADSLGLYHFTTAAANTREGQSRVDIGYHYVALNGSSLPWDLDSDSIPDYIEDPNGLSHLNAAAIAGGNGPTQGFRVFITRPKNGENRP
jgi:hypothetical protein